MGVTLFTGYKLCFAILTLVGSSELGNPLLDGSYRIAGLTGVCPVESMYLLLMSTFKGGHTHSLCYYDC